MVIVKLMQKILLLFYCVYFSTYTVAQLTGNSVQLYTTENGLPSNGIKGMQWDEKTNFLWIATEAGIVRFNGSGFISYTKENLPDIESERMMFITRNNSGNIYFSDIPGNIFKIDKNKPVLWRKSPGNINPFYSNYFLLPVSDTFFLSKKNINNTSRFSAVTDKIICINDTASIILNQATLYAQSISQNNPVLLPFETKSFQTIFKIGNSCFVLNNKKGIFLLNTTSYSLTPVLVYNENGKIFIPEFNDNQLYWETGMNKPIYIDGTKAYVYEYDNNKITTRLLHQNIPEDAFIKSIQYSEKNKILFIGTDSKGLIVLSQNRVTSLKRKTNNLKKRNSIYAQIELPDGNILTNEGDILGFNPTAVISPPVKGKFGFNVSQIGDSILFYFQQNIKQGVSILHNYNKKTGKTIFYKNIKSESIATTSGADIWITNNVGILKLEGDSFQLKYKNPKEVTGNLAYDIIELEPGVLFLATCAGILRYTISTNKLDTILKAQQGCIRNIRKIKDYVFFGTYGSGYYIYKNGVIKPMPLDKNKYLLYTHCFVPDNKGYCWLSTNRGLFKASLDEIINAFETNSSTVYYHYFGKKDGMDMTELNGGCTPCALYLKNNFISFPSMDGLLWVSPEKSLPILPEGEIFIDEILVDNNKVNVDSLQYKSLSSTTQDIAIKLVFSAWCNKENIYIDYQLNDTLKWKPVNTDNETVIRLSNLPSGKYLLRIRKLNGFGINNYTFKEISFTIKTPWYNQWWFYLLSLLSVIGLVVLFFQIRTNQYKIRQYKLERQVAEKTKELQQQNEILEKNNTIKTRLISIISHDIVTPLKFLTVAGKKLIEKRKLMSEELQQETIQEMTNTSQELQLLSTNILNWIKYQNENRRLAKENFNLYELVNQVLGILNSLARQKNLNLVNTVSPHLEVYQYVEPLKILIYNLLTNAINFSEKGDIIIEAKLLNELVVISIKDEGVGMTADQIKNIMADQFIISSANIDNRKGNGLGYLIIKDLIKMMEASLQINSEKGIGTVISIKIPVSKS